MPSRPTICPECGAEVECGAVLGKDECWCARYPHLATVPASPGASCFCETCLQRRLAAAGPLPIVD